MTPRGPLGSESPMNPAGHVTRANASYKDIYRRRCQSTDGDASARVRAHVSNASSCQLRPLFRHALHVPSDDEIEMTSLEMTSFLSSFLLAFVNSFLLPTGVVIFFTRDARGLLVTHDTAPIRRFPTNYRVQFIELLHLGSLCMQYFQTF